MSESIGDNVGIVLDVRVSSPLWFAGVPANAKQFAPEKLCRCPGQVDPGLEERGMAWERSP